MNLSATSSGFLLMAASAWLITSASFQPPLSTLAIGITIVRTAGLFRAIFRYAERYLTHTTIFSALTGIRIKFYKMAMAKFPLKSGITGESEMLHDLTVSADLLKDLFPRVVQPIICTIIITAIVNIYLFKTIGIISIILTFALLINFVISYLSSKSRLIDDTAYREMLLDFNGGSDEVINAGSDKIAVEKLNEQADLLNKSEQNNRNKTINIDSLCNIINFTAMIFILNDLIACVNVIDLAVWLFILISTVEMFSALPDAVKTFHGIIAAQNIFDKSTVEDEGKIFIERANSFKITDLSFGYNSKVKVLDNLNLEVSRGEKIAIIGESGSGKTTFLYILLGLWTPDSGKIFINGSISAATTNNYIFSTSIRENFLIMHPNITQERITDTLRICQLENLDIDRNIGENASKLSGGERCRLQIALALASDSNILILDEPTAGLDRRTANNLINEIINDTNKKNRTLIIITHDLAIAKMMSVIYKLYDGKLNKCIDVS